MHEKKATKIGELVTTAKNEEAEYQEINFGILANYKAQEIAAKTQVVVRGCLRILSIDGIRHTFTTHGDHKLEDERGQIGIVDEDFEHIPEIINNYDWVETGNQTNRRKGEGVVFIKVIGDKLYHVVMKVRHTKDKSILEFKTMYIRKK